MGFFYGVKGMEDYKIKMNLDKYVGESLRYKDLIMRNKGYSPLYIYPMGALAFLEDIGIINTEERQYLFNIHNAKSVTKISRVYDVYYYDIVEEGNTYEYGYKLLLENITEEYSELLKSSPYNMYLISPYWNIIKNYKKRISLNRCQLCSNKKNLHVHHNNYKNRGYEYKNLDDLIVLCKICHTKHHNKTGVIK
jgi:hypothetical protein